MSKAKDRARAESGWIYRNGELVRKEEWYKAHPTREMLAERQVTVDAAIRDEMAKKFPKQEIVQPDKLITIPEAETELAAPQGKPYFCTKCLKYHKKPDSNIYKAHTEYEDYNVPTI